MSKLQTALLWLTVPALFTLRMTTTRVARRNEMRTIFIDSVSRLMLVGAIIWMVVRGSWGTVAILIGLLAVLIVLRAMTVAFMVARAGAAHR